MYSNPINNDDKHDLWIPSSNIPAPRLLNWVQPLVTNTARNIQDFHKNSPIHIQRLAHMASLNPPSAALVRVTYRPLLIEMHLAKIRGELLGDSTKTRFIHFTSRLLDEEYRQIISDKYPAMQPEVVALLDDWLVNSTQLCQDFHSIENQLSRLVPDVNLAEIESLDFFAGDSHGRQQAVSKITVSGKDIFYKPRPGINEEFFTEILLWTNKHGFSPFLAGTTVIDSNSHSWVAAVEPKECETLSQVHDYYRRLGGLIALSHLLCITDLHQENLIAVGDQPLIIDLETLFDVPLRTNTDNTHYASSVTRSLIMESVLATGLLPTPQFNRTADEIHRVDLSGMNADSKQLTIASEPFFANVNTDEMCVSSRPAKITGEAHLPKLNTQIQNSISNEEHILEGFNRMYRLLQQHRDKLNSSDSPLKKIGQIPTRHLTGPTDMFGRLLWNSYHPYFLRSYTGRTEYLDKIPYRHGDLYAGPEIFSSEKRQLLDGGIPLFNSIAATNNLLGADGKKVFAALHESGVERVRNRLASLCDADCRYQSSLITAAIRTQAPASVLAWPRVVPTLNRNIPRSADWLVESAEEIGEYLLSIASWTNGQPAWLTYSLYGDSYWAPQMATTDYYSGSIGIGIFLAYLGFETSATKFKDAAWAVLNQSTNTLEANLDHRTPNALGMSGWYDGVVYFATVWAKLTGDGQPLKTTLEKGAGVYKNYIATDTKLDVIGGSAGSILILAAALPNLDKSTQLRVKQYIKLASNHLTGIHHGLEQEPWWSTQDGSRVGTGFAHGVSGIALALAIAAQITGLTNNDILISGALSRQNSTLAMQVTTRLEPYSNNDRFAWCHGLPGETLARVKLPQRFHTKSLVNDVNVMADSISKYYNLHEGKPPTVYNLSLCHGLLGNLEITDEIIASGYGGQNLINSREQMLYWTFSTLKNDGWVCGAPQGITPPDLFTGVAGIGYGLLRASSETSIPAALSLGLMRQSPNKT